MVDGIAVGQAGRATGTADAGDGSACTVSPSSETRLTDTLDVLAAGCAGDRVSLDDLTRTLGDKCFAGLIFILAAPNVLPTPPGTSAVLGVPLILVTLQLMLGMRRPWLPAVLLSRDVSTERFAGVADRISSLTARAERLLTRRLDALTGLIGRRVVGALCLILSIVLSLPIPLGDTLPAAAISLLALGLLTRDGWAVIAGTAVAVVSAAVIFGLTFGTVEAVDALF